MPVFGETLSIRTRGFSDVIDITAEVKKVISRSGLRNGIVCVSSIGSTASVTTIEFEPALVTDIKETLEKWIPSTMRSRHSETWGDDNGFSHLRASLMGPGTALPLTDGALLTGTWQQIVIIDHDNRPRDRRVRVQIVGE